MRVKRDKGIVLINLSGFVGVGCDSCDCLVEDFKTEISEPIEHPCLQLAMLPFLDLIFGFSCSVILASNPKIGGR